MRSLQHTYWVMAEANEMKEYLESAGIELVGEPIVPGNDNRDKYPSIRTFTLGINFTF